MGSIRKRTRNGKVRYEVVMDLPSGDGKRKQESRTVDTAREAKSVLAAWTKEIEGGTSVSRSVVTVKDVALAWLEGEVLPNRRPVTYANYEMVLSLYLIPYLGAVPIQKILPETIGRFYAERRAAGLGARSIQTCHLRLHQICEYALRMGLVSRNVVKLVIAPYVEYIERLPWTTQEALAFLALADTGIHSPLFRIALLCGLRRGELLGLRWSDLNSAQRTLSVRQSVVVAGNTLVVQGLKSKAAKRDVAVDDLVVEQLRERKKAQNAQRLRVGSAWHPLDLIFCKEDGSPIWPTNIDRHFHLLCEKAGVPRVRLHDLRHTHVTLALASGLPVEVISRNLGHSKIAMTYNVYAHVLPDRKHEIAEKLSKLLAPDQEEKKEESQ